MNIFPSLEHTGQSIFFKNLFTMVAVSPPIVSHKDYNKKIERDRRIQCRVLTVNYHKQITTRLCIDSPACSAKRQLVVVADSYACRLD